MTQRGIREGVLLFYVTDLDLYTQNPYDCIYNCRGIFMEKILNLRVDAEFVQKVEYLMRINGYKSKSETIRKIIEKEYRKENT